MNDEEIKKENGEDIEALKEEKEFWQMLVKVCAGRKLDDVEGKA